MRVNGMISMLLEVFRSLEPAGVPHSPVWLRWRFGLLPEHFGPLGRAEINRLKLLVQIICKG